MLAQNTLISLASLLLASAGHSENLAALVTMFSGVA